jgi:hypothetical protein
MRTNRAGLSRVPPLRGADRLLEDRQPGPTASDTIFEIGIVLGLHLAAVLAILLALDALGVS